MFLDRQDNRKQIEQAYRKELKSEIDNKRSRIISNKNTQQYRPQKESFSLIANIEREQNERKKKNQMYYDDLRNQMEMNRKEKQQKEAEKKQKQLEEENKIKQQQRRLQQRYQEELKKQNKGKKNHVTEMKNDHSPQNLKRKRGLSMSKELPELVKKQENQTEIRRDKSYSSQYAEAPNINFQQSTDNYSPLVTSLYPNKVENETFNFISRNVYKDSYYKQLLGQRRKLEEQTSQISELNRIFNAERYKRRQQSRGLQQLRNLEKMLDNKNSEYLDLNIGEGKTNIAQSGKLKPINKIQKTNIFAPRVNKDEWRKLD